MKRIAIELYGLTRSYKSTFDNFFFNLLQENYKDDYIIDIFIHTWSESDSSDINWHNPNGTSTGNDLNAFIYKDLMNKYNPKAIIVDSPLDIDKSIVIQEKICNNKRSYSSLVSCFYSRYKVNELRRKYENDHNIKYDWVLMTRFDVTFLTPFKINTYLEAFKQWQLTAEKDAIYTVCAPFRDNVIETRGTTFCSDIILFTSPKTMDSVTEFYRDLKENKIELDFILDNSYGMEVLWTTYWERKNIESIKIKYLQYIDFDIVRGEAQCQAELFMPKRVNNLKTRFDSNLKQIWHYFKPFFSWFSEIFSVFYYFLKISLKVLERLFRCI